jgi:hypothetical protein
MTSSVDIKNKFTKLKQDYIVLRTLFDALPEQEQIQKQNIVTSIGGLINFLEQRENVLDRPDVLDNFLRSFNALISFLDEKIKFLKTIFSSGCTDDKYILSNTLNNNTILDKLVYKPNTDKYPEAVNCPVKDVLVPQINTNENNEFVSYKVFSTYDATNGVLNTTIDMELVDADIFNKELNRTDPDKPDIPGMIKSIIQRIINQTNITEFTITGENNRPILSSNPSQPPSTYAYGGYKNLKNAITDRYLKLNLKIHNPTQGFKITHLINVPQTYTNCYAQKEPNYEKI